MTVAKHEIILYHYPFSPYARRVIWYLHLRRLPYTQCLQPPILPRPSLSTLGVSYRRIPLLSIGRDMYLDSRLIIAVLEERYPPCEEYPGIAPKSPEGKLMARLWDGFNTEGGVFKWAAGLIPGEAPLLQNPAFTADRLDFSGTKWDMASMERARPENLIGIRSVCAMLEHTILADGREWIMGNGEGPGLVDIEAIWPIHWLTTLPPSALPSSLISPTQYPHLFTYLTRFSTTLAHAASLAKPHRSTLTGSEVLSYISSLPDFPTPSTSSSGSSTGGLPGVWASEETLKTNLEKGDQVQLWPKDTGFRHKDTGVLVGLDGERIVIERELGDGQNPVQAEEGGNGNSRGRLRIHAPRMGFRVRKVGEEGKL